MKAARIKRLLPAVYQTAADDGTPLAALLGVMEAMHAPAELVLAQIESHFDPYRAPDAFVPYLASWVDLGRMLDRPRGGSRSPSFPAGVGRLRELTAAAITLSQWRGTRKGLLLFLETATGIAGFTIDEEVRGTNGDLVAFHISVVAPVAAAIYKSLIERIIELEKPAYVTYELTFTAPADAAPVST